jgi:hypothetical protein
MLTAGVSALLTAVYVAVEVDMADRQLVRSALRIVLNVIHQSRVNTFKETFWRFFSTFPST